MHWYEEEVRALERRHRAFPPPEGSIVFYGSSSIRLWSTLEQDLPNLPLVNCGFGGSTLDACSWFFHRLVVPLRPRALIVYAGDNDLGDGRSPDQVLSSYRALTDQIGAHLGSIPYTFLSIKPSPARSGLTDVIRQTNERIRREHAYLPGGIYVDVFTPMLGRDGLPRRELYAEDGLHLSSDGYHLWRDLLTLYRHLWL